VDAQEILIEESLADIAASSEYKKLSIVIELLEFNFTMLRFVREKKPNRVIFRLIRRRISRKARQLSSAGAKMDFYRHVRRLLPAFPKAYALLY